LDRPGFGDHLAQASGSTQNGGKHSDLRESPAPSGPLERDSGTADSGTIDDESSDADLSPDEYAACAEPAEPAACGGDESESSESETTASVETPAENSSDTTAVEEPTARNENRSEADSDKVENATGAAASGANVARQTDAATTSLQVALTDVTDAVQSETGVGDENSNGQQSESQRPQGERASPGSNSPGTASDITGNLPKLDGEGKTSPLVQTSTSPAGDDAQIALAETGELHEAQPPAEEIDKASRKSADRHELGRANDASRDHALAHNVGNIQSKSNDGANNSTRRASDKIKSTDDSRRRTNEKSESRGAQRTDSIGNINQSVPNPVVSDIRVDAVAASTKHAGDESAAKPGNAPAAKSDVLLHPLARTNRGHGVAGRAGRSDSANSLPRVDTTRFVGRVAKAIQSANERGGALQLRLSPPELGSLRLQLTVYDGVMTASLEAESPAARQLLLDHLPSLRDRLADQNIRIDRFDVDVRQEGSGGQPDPRSSQNEQRQQQFQHSTSRREAPRGPNVDGSAPDTTVLQSRITNDGLNVLA
jgi:flagellar hook-length control protein FliK